MLPHFVIKFTLSYVTYIVCDLVAFIRLIFNTNTHCLMQIAYFCAWYLFIQTIQSIFGHLSYSRHCHSSISASKLFLHIAFTFSTYLIPFKVLVRCLYKKINDAFNFCQKIPNTTTNQTEFFIKICSCFKGSFKRKFYPKKKNSLNFMETIGQLNRMIDRMKDYYEKLTEKIQNFVRRKRKRIYIDTRPKPTTTERQHNGLEQMLQKTRDQFAFAFVKGLLIECVEKGHWLLLDEINLANSESLGRICGILDRGGSTDDRLGNDCQILYLAQDQFARDKHLQSDCLLLLLQQDLQQHLKSAEEWSVRIHLIFLNEINTNPDVVTLKEVFCDHMCIEPFPKLQRTMKRVPMSTNITLTT
ncbi:hypothetical protein RFI_09354 [Reticulomyxa filosa]|uniref:ATPase dynein-related AAA domain-containing protein n=1 Tax=Reticulomyxa filosa TaxID=46433 RepID=X6NQZ7_RETFI|nr:hypothetical protein RFI_09354 [Reticulomyxa filosa]|eukprot:ETO27777.1 hypothetical protein RFI_09354 [Reticulomyxa filosa]